MDYNNLSEEDIKKIQTGAIDICDLISTQPGTGIFPNNATYFFKRAGNEGYFEKSEFLTWLLGLTDDERRKLKLLLEYMSRKVRLNNLPFEKTDSHGRPYIWCRFLLPNAIQEFKVIVGGEMIKFIKDYQQGIFSPNFSLNQLYLEAEQSV
ncbi:MAG: hypothetical protein EOO43_09510 [Flavobacterium sp.]|nr:MAG: hypothetical protein EOO43_09510 [Flavobacterium sp.]